MKVSEVIVLEFTRVVCQTDFKLSMSVFFKTVGKNGTARHGTEQYQMII